jgi:hypothetical protein
MHPAFERTIHGMPHRGKLAPHNVVPDYPRDAAREAARRVLEAQARDWARRPPQVLRGAEAPAPPSTTGVTEEIAAPYGPRLLSSAHGRIREIVLAYPELPGDQTFRHQLYVDFIRAFPGVSFRILAHRTTELDVQSVIDDAGAADRAGIVIAPDYLNFTMWIEDPFEVAQDTREAKLPTFLLKPHTFVRGGDDLVADVLSDTMRIRHAQLPLMYQGGNVLVGDTFVLVGSDHLTATATLIQGTAGTSDHVVILPPGADATELAQQLFEQTFDCTREFVYVGTTLPVPTLTTVNDGTTTQTLFDGVGVSQPIFHLDMFISLAGRTRDGRYRLVVGSPALADQLLARATLPQSLSSLFDDVARTLRQHPEFDVVRSPLPLEIANVGDTDWCWYYATSNNCIVEIVDEQEKTVWLPQYGFGEQAHLAVIDDYNTTLWREWGFEVVPLGNYNEVAQCFGAAHCLKKIIHRDPVPAVVAPPASS